MAMTPTPSLRARTPVAAAEILRATAFVTDPRRANRASDELGTTASALPRRALACVALALLAAGCSSTHRSGPTPDTAGAALAPAHVAADASLAPIAFLAGTWTQAQPKGAMIEEHWMEPRGKSMLGSFRRILGNGVTPFYEFTQIVAEPDGVHLRQIHVHGNFETDPRRKDAMHLRLDRSAERMVSFVPIADAAAAHAGSLERVTYTLGADGVLTVRVEERPRATDPAKPVDGPQVLEFRMTRVGR